MKLQKSVRIFADRHLEKLGNVFESLYRESLLTDCILYCKDGSIKAHKVILAASSRYFRQVFIDHGDDNAIFMYGISYSQLKNLVELIYRGSIDIPSDSFNTIYGLAEDLKVTGVLVDSSHDSKNNGIGRDTRYRGQKRVAVDYDNKEDPKNSPSKNTQAPERRSSSSSESNSTRREPDTDKDPLQPKEEAKSSVIDLDNINESDSFVGHEVLDDGDQGSENLSVWAKKERKFKCDLCPSSDCTCSFKRASHLSRHQLVHTGERPFACDQCDKAFSRHDKLKNHVHKTHELGALNEALGADSLYTINHVDILTPETNMVESNTVLSQQQTDQNMSSGSSMDFGDTPAKKGRGRPRKYPPVPKPLVKRPRGRPRINPIVARPLIKRPRGRPRLNPTGTFGYGHGYQPYSRESFGDMDYYQKFHNPCEMDSSQNNSENDNELMDHEQGIMEPLVEINTDMAEKPPAEEEQPSNSNFFENIGLFENSSAIAKIGECTISVASSCSGNVTKNEPNN